MADSLEGRASELLKDTNHAAVTTLNADGTPHNVFVWVDVDDGKVVLNSAEGRLWPTNAQRDPRMAVLVANRDYPGEYVEIRGRAEASHDDGDAIIDHLSRKFIGQDYPYRQPDEVRVTIRVAPDRVRYQKQ
jgi:PPOX class probable F420-dependent enzyme